LAAIAVGADDDLTATVLARTAENAKRPIDHRRPGPPVSGQAPRSERYGRTVARPRGALEGSDCESGPSSFGGRRLL